MKQLLLVAAIFFIVSQQGWAQTVPDINRWESGTTLPQPGFDQGDPITLTWGFAEEGLLIPEAGFGYGNANNDIREFLDMIYGSQAVWQPIFADVFDRWSELCGASYIYEPNDDGATFVTAPGQLGVRADIRIAGKPMNGDFGLGAYNYFPDSGDMVIDSIDFGIYSSDILMRNLLAHEHGHGLGMSHVNTPETFLMKPFIDGTYDGPQYHDILIAHRGYGDFNEKSNSGAGNDTFGTAFSLGVIVHGGDVSIGQDAADLFVFPSETDFVSIDDQTDVDVYSFAVDGPAVIDVMLEAFGETYQVGPQFGSTITFATQMRSDLAVELLASDGSVLDSSNLTGLGGDEEIIGYGITDPGTYFVRVTGIDNPDPLSIDTQFYGLTVNVAAIPETIAPDSVDIGQGIVAAGDVTDLELSDNSDLSIRRDNLAVAAVVLFEVKGVTTIALPSQLSFTIEASVFARGTISQRIELFNYDSDSYEVVDTRDASRFSDTVTVFDATGDTTRFVQPGTQCIEARIRYSSSVNRAQFTANVDQIKWDLE